ncbi:unnamed protein product [Pedinophyceae sp. YPF-701]|nr:unnamed protein product [Pedinophyceae sp. YPF-701]
MLGFPDGRGPPQPAFDLAAAMSVGGRIAQAVAPLLAHTAVSGAAFGASLAATQVACMSLRISAATVLAPQTIGVACVVGASIVAGQASRRLDLMGRLGVHHSMVGSGYTTRKEDLIADALVGLSFFRVAGGNFRSALPSDVRFPGALSGESVPASGKAYANEWQRRELLRLFRRWGCHHCGSRRGRPIGDHMPPNMSAHGNTKGRLGPLNWQEPDEVVNRGLRSTIGRLPVVGRKLRLAPPKQRYYPQCESCSQKQSAAMRNWKKVLVFHFGGPRSQYFAGAFVGLRHALAHGEGTPAAGRPWRWSKVVDALMKPVREFQREFSDVVTIKKR